MYLLKRGFRNILEIKESRPRSSIFILREQTRELRPLNVLSRKHSSQNFPPFSDKVGYIKTLDSEDARFVQVTWNSGKKSRFPNLFLRENCKCSLCFHPKAKQRLVIVSKEKSVISRTSIKENGTSFQCHWSDGHVSEYSSNWLHYRCFPEEDAKVVASESTSTLKDGCELVSSHYNLSERAYEYERVMNDDKTLLYWLYDLCFKGLTLIRNAPEKEGELYRLAKRIGHYKPTIHGESWMVKDVGDVNLAYTNVFLMLHTDIPILINPPDVQALHCIESKVEGATNSFLDGFNAARELKNANPKAFDVLSSTMVPYHDGAITSLGEFIADSARPIIQLNASGQLDKIYFSNGIWGDYFEDVTPEAAVDFYEAKAAFTKYFESKELIIRHKLKPGEIYFFNNNRVLHGRDAYVGERWLEGMYFDWDPIVSKVKIYNRKFGYPLPVKYHKPPHFS